MTDFSMLYDLDEASLWINSDRITNIPSNMEFFGFGSGDFADGATANDVLSDPNGRWFRYCLTGPVKDLLVIVECDRKLPEEVKGLAIWNKVTEMQSMSLSQHCVCVCVCMQVPVDFSCAFQSQLLFPYVHSSHTRLVLPWSILHSVSSIHLLCESVEVTTLKRLLVDLEDAGELVTIMGHTKTDDELKCNEKIVFIMDPLKSGAKKRKISKACGTASSVVLCSGADVCQMCAGVCLFLRCGFEARPLSFGAYMEPSKIRALRPPFHVTWRMRPVYISPTCDITNVRHVQSQTNSERFCVCLPNLLPDPFRLTHHRVLSPVRPVLLHGQEVQVTPGVLRLF